MRASRTRPSPSRSCVACRTVRPKHELIRVVRTPDGRVVIDDTGRLAGRGAYLCRHGDCTRIGPERALPRALDVPIPDELQTRLVAITNIPQGGAHGQE